MNWGGGFNPSPSPTIPTLGKCASCYKIAQHCYQPRERCVETWAEYLHIVMDEVINQCQEH